jgi:hypothetical protein
VKAVGRLTAVGACVLALSACSPEVDGVTGLTRDSRGGLVGVSQACRGELLGATLIEDANTDTSRHIGNWRAGAPVTKLAWSLQQPSPPYGWSVWNPASEQLSPQHVYTLVAWRELNVTNAAPLDFTTADLSALKAGQVLVSAPDAAGGRPKTTLVSTEEFARRACK